MKTPCKAQLLVLVLLASASLWPQAGSTAKPQTGEANYGSVSTNRVQVSREVAERSLIYKVVPPYPSYAKTNRIQGRVLLHAIIDKQGRVVELKTISGRQELVSAARDAVQQWRYRPYLLNGNLVEVETTVVMNFNLAHVAGDER